MAAEERSTFHMVVDAHDDMEPDSSRHLMEQINERLEKVAGAVEATGREGSVTLKIKVSRDGTGRAQFSPGLDAKIPSPPMTAVTLWVKEGGKLSRTNPQQKTLEFPGPKAVRRSTNNEEN